MPRSPVACILALALLAACGRDAPDAGSDPDQADAPAPTPRAGARSAAATPPAARVHLDARPIVGQGEAGVRTMLGTPLACADVAGGRRCTYAQGRSEVVYIDGMADHIVIADLGGAAFEPATIARIGLAGEEPLNVGPDAIEWQNVGGMRSVVLERGPDGRAGRFVIKAMTP